MSIFQYLNETLKSPRVMAGRANCYFDEARGSFQVWFKAIDGDTYQFTATSENYTWDDNVWKVQMSKKIAGDTEAISEDVVKDFVEAITEWAKLRNPTTFWWVSSEQYPAYNSIAKALSKKLKEYNFIDETDVEPETKYDVVEDAPEHMYKRFIFTQQEPKEVIDSMEATNKKLDKNEETFDVYEEPEEIKPNKDHTTPFAKDGKLDKKIGYNESIADTMKKMLKETRADKLDRLTEPMIDPEKFNDLLAQTSNINTPRFKININDYDIPVKYHPLVQRLIKQKTIWSHEINEEDNINNIKEFLQHIEDKKLNNRFPNLKNIELNKLTLEDIMHFNDSIIKLFFDNYSKIVYEDNNYVICKVQTNYDYFIFNKHKDIMTMIQLYYVGEFNSDVYIDTAPSIEKSNDYFQKEYIKYVKDGNHKLFLEAIGLNNFLKQINTRQN